MIFIYWCSESNAGMKVVQIIYPVHLSRGDEKRLSAAFTRPIRARGRSEIILLRIERLAQIVYQVLRVFDADGQA